MKQFEVPRITFLLPNPDRVLRGGSVAGNEQPAVTSVSHCRLHGNMEAQIHQLEQEAYSAVLRAFKAQSDALTWVCIFSSLQFFFILSLIIFMLSCFQESSPVFCFYVLTRRKKV